MSDASDTKTNARGEGAGGGAVREQALREELRQLVGVASPASLVDLLMERAFESRATDIHFDPTENGLRLRLRVDGLLHEVLELSPDVTGQVVSRLKLMAGMDITEKRLSQDGHIANEVLGRKRDIRVASGPTVHGERLVLRLVPNDEQFTRLEDLGLDEEQIGRIRRAVEAPYGMVLSVGPVGAGKSTTMYSCLELLNQPYRSLVTIEDPVERRIKGVNQIQVDPRIDFEYAEAVRGVLRQDPDVIMLGEIRDSETAHVACQSGLSGVTVLSTLHANDSAGAINVFREFDVPAMMIANSLEAIVAQRLVRKVCPDCRTSRHPDAGTCGFLGVDPSQSGSIELTRGAGCDRCFQTGYRGRTGVFEVMPVRDDIREAVLREASHREIFEIARSAGMQTLEESARRKVLAGVTTVEEVHRVLASWPA